jgi:hypothetical protein
MDGSKQHRRGTVWLTLAALLTLSLLSPELAWADRPVTSGGGSKAQQTPVPSR